MEWFMADPSPKSGRQTYTSQFSGNDKDEKYVNPIYAALGTLLPKKVLKSGSEAEKFESDELNFSPVLQADTKRKNLPIDEMRTLIETGLKQDQWMVTGKVHSWLFRDDFSFSDPSVAVSSLAAYARGVNKLFYQDGSKMDVYDVVAKDDSTLEINWRLEATINIPFKPRIKPFKITTTYWLDEDGLVWAGEDKFEVNDFELLISIFFPSFGVITPPLEG
eukprot:gene22052-26569_t